MRALRHTDQSAMNLLIEWTIHPLLYPSHRRAVYLLYDSVFLSLLYVYVCVCTYARVCIGARRVTRACASQVYFYFRGTTRQTLKVRTDGKRSLNCCVESGRATRCDTVCAAACNVLRILDVEYVDDKYIRIGQ